MPSDRPKKPHGRFTPASTIGRVLSRAGYGREIIRRGVGYGGHRCTWDHFHGVVLVGYRCPDSTPASKADAERAEMFDLYEQVLTAKGYRVERTDRFLFVNPVKEAAMPKPTLAEQIAAVAVLRNFASLVPRYVHPTEIELGVIEAIKTLDNADLFAALDTERFDQEATQEDRTP